MDYNLYMDRMNTAQMNDEQAVEQKQDENLFNREQPLHTISKEKKFNDEQQKNTAKINFQELVEESFGDKDVLKEKLNAAQETQRIRKKREIETADKNILDTTGKMRAESDLSKQLLANKRFFFRDSTEMIAVKDSVRKIDSILNNPIEENVKVVVVCRNLLSAYDGTIKNCNTYLFNSNKSTTSVRYNLVKRKMDEVIENKRILESFFRRHIEDDLERNKPKTGYQLLMLAKLEGSLRKQNADKEEMKKHPQNTLQVDKLDAPSQIVFRFLTQNAGKDDYGNEKTPDQIEFVKNLYRKLVSRRCIQGERCRWRCEL